MGQTTIRELQGNAFVDRTREEAIELIRNEERLVWIDAQGTDADCLELLQWIAQEKLLPGLDPPRAARHERDPTDRPPKVKGFHGFVFARAYALETRRYPPEGFDRVELVVEEMHVIAGATFVITLRYPCVAWDLDEMAGGERKMPYPVEGGCLDTDTIGAALIDFRSRVPQGHPKNLFGVEMALVLVDRVVDSVFDALNVLREVSDEAEERVLRRDWVWSSKAWPGMERRILGLHRMLRQVRWAFLPSDEIMELASGPFLDLPQDDRGIVFRYQDLQREAERATETVRAVTSQVEQIVTLRDSFKNDRLSRTMYVLTVVATVILIPTLIAGIYGMNVVGLPFAEREVGFWGTLLTMVGLGAIVWFGIRGYLKRTK